MGHVFLILGRHGADDHYLGGRFRPAGAGRRADRRTHFRLDRDAVHLFELVEHNQRRQPVPARRIFPEFTTRYQATALRFAEEVEQRGGSNFNAEARADEEMDRNYSRLCDAAKRSDLAFFKEPTYARFREFKRDDVAFGKLREDLMISNVNYFASQGLNVIARLGRIHSRVRMNCEPGLQVTTVIGLGRFFPAQVLYRRAVLGLRVTEEDWQRGYVDQMLRTVPMWGAGSELPPKEVVFSLRGDDLRSVTERFESLAMRTGSLPSGEGLLEILAVARGARGPRLTRQSTDRSSLGRHG